MGKEGGMNLETGTDIYTLLCKNYITNENLYGTGTSTQCSGGDLNGCCLATQLCPTLWTPSQHARLLCPSPSSRACSNSCPLSQWCHPTISSSAIPFSICLQFFPNIRVFSNESALHMRWPKCWSFSFNISTSNIHPELISFRMDWLDLLAFQETQETSATPQCKLINSSALSFLYRPTLPSIHDWWKIHRLTFVGKVMSLLLNMLSTLVITFL